MKRIDFESLERIPGFDVDVRIVHGMSSHISMVDLKEGERFEMDPCDFNAHLIVLSGEVEVSANGKEEMLKSGCAVSILPRQGVKIQALKSSRLALIKDDPLWVLRERRSVRKYAALPVPRETVEKILRIALLAPSAGNLQPWRVYAVSDAGLKEKLARASYGQDHVAQAAWDIVVVAVPRESAVKYGERGEKLYSIQDTAALVTYITLAAKAYGLDTCWVGAFDEDAVREILKLPEGYRPVAIVTLGHSEERPEIPQRKSEVIQFLEG